MVISSACLLRVNRSAYRYIHSIFNIPLHLVVPFRSNIAKSHGEITFDLGEAFQITPLELSGPHARLEWAPGLMTLISFWKPTHILVESDPATLLVFGVALSSQKNKSKLAIISLENQHRNFLTEALEGIKNGRLKIALGGLIAHFILWAVRRKIDWVYGVCQDGVEVMNQLGFKGKTSKIPLGFDDKLFYPKSKAEVLAVRHRLGLNSMTIAYFGRLVPEKGVDLLLKALALIKDLKWQLLIDTFSAYKSPYEIQLKARISELNLDDRIIYFDSTHTEIPLYMNAADIVVLPSISTPKFKEQYGRVIQEAMACGKIFIGSESGAIPELIADAGFTFQEGDVVGLAKILRHLLTETKDSLDEWRKKAISRAHSDLSAKKQAELIRESFLCIGE